jgi:tripartite-type tricarboxylate transporter receptor subunit TctC
MQMKKALVCCALAALCVPALAQTYPAKPVHMIIPFAPGGASDFVGRIIQPRLGELLGQQLVIENRPGAAGNIGMEAAARAAPDGYTVYLGNIGTVAINPSIFPELKVNPVKDFAAVTAVVDVPSVLVVNSSSAVTGVKDFVAGAKANPGKLNYASPGSGSQNRLEMELLRKIAGLDMVHVPYKGGAGPAVAGLVGNETSAMFTTLPSAIGQVRGGRLRALAVTSAQRLEQLPAVPTMVESGYADFLSSSWQGIFVPTGTPQSVVQRLHADALKTVATQDVVERLAKGGVQVMTSRTPQEFLSFVIAESARWGKLAKDVGATID